MRTLSTLLLVGLFVIASYASAGPTDSVSSGIQLAQIDFDVIHDRLVDKCRVAYPSSVPALAEAIGQWNTRNAEALKELRQLSKENLMRRMRLPESEVAIRTAQLSEFMTNGLKAQFENLSGNELKAACEGEYAAKSLQSPSLDFAALLTQVRGANSKP
jgi:hypothetical protein